MTPPSANHNGDAEVDIDDDMLGRHSLEDSPLLQQDHGPQQPDDAIEQERARLRPRAIILSLAVIFLAELAVNVGVPAMNAVLEAIICGQMHPEVASGTDPSGRLSTLPADTADSVCKSADVQSYLATIRGWQATFEAIPNILCAIPYGILADRWGRKPVLILSALGLNLGLGFSYGVLFFSNILPVWTVWFGAVFML